jgi:hypothetical protein
VVYDAADRHICSSIPEQLGASILREAANCSEMSLSDYQLTSQLILILSSHFDTLCLSLYVLVIVQCHAVPLTLCTGYCAVTHCASHCMYWLLCSDTLCFWL